MKKFNNKGAALVSVMIAITFISIVATTLLVITLNNYQMKVVNSQSKSNFYETEQRINVVTAQVRNKIVGSTNVAQSVGSALNSNTSQDYSGTTFNFPYNKEKVAELAFPDISTLQTGTDGDGYYVKVFEDPSNPSSPFDKFYFKDGTVSVEAKTNGKQITIKDLTIKQVSSDKSGGYENTIKTDVDFYIEIATSGGGSGGGIGSCAFLLDNTIQIDGGPYENGHSSRLNIAGNTIMGKYVLKNAAYNSWYDASGNEQASEISLTNHSEPVSISKTYNSTTGKVEKVNIADANVNNAIIYLNSSSYMVFTSDYNVILGDVYLKDKSVLTIIDGSFTVYGDIFVETGSAFICDGNLSLGYNSNIYSVNPSSSGNNCTLITSSNKSKNIILPSTINNLDKKNYDKMASHLKLLDGDGSNDGILPNILRKAQYTVAPSSGSVTGGRYCYESYNSGGKESGTLCTFDGIEYKAAIPQGDLNGDYKNELLLISENLNNPELKMTQNTPNCTIISIKPVYAYDTQNICVSRMGDLAFNKILTDGGSFTFKVKNDSGNDSGDVTYDVKDFFKNGQSLPGGGNDTYCNQFVSTVFNISNNNVGGGTPTPTKTRIAYQKWTKE